MTTPEMDTIAALMELIETHRIAERAAWKAYMDATTTEAQADARETWQGSCQDLAVTVDIYMPEIKRALKEARRAAA